MVEVSVLFGSDCTVFVLHFYILCLSVLCDYSMYAREFILYFMAASVIWNLNEANMMLYIDFTSRIRYIDFLTLPFDNCASLY